ncbi:MAG: hypothetical protein K2X08_08455 [Chlamydiales bacterium]|nr:hypothetical protein [Chlamydiales bacterium]
MQITVFSTEVEKKNIFYIVSALKESPPAEYYLLLLEKSVVGAFEWKDAELLVQLAPPPHWGASERCVLREMERKPPPKSRN